ncbi:hypothetical protein D3C78_1163780 [compost metagenome]
MDLGGPYRISRQPATVAVLLRQVNQNRVGIGQHHALVINHRHLTESIEREVRRLLVFALGEINQDQFGRQLQQGQHQLDTMSVAGTWEVVEFDRLHGRYLGVSAAVQERWVVSSTHIQTNRITSQRNPLFQCLK